MSWAKIDDHLFCHPKMLTVSLAARGLWLTALSYAAGLERDGWFPMCGLAMLARSDVDLAPLAAELVQAKLWIRTADGYRIHDYLRYNPSAKQLQKLRKDATTRQRVSRMRHAVTSREVTRACHTVPARPGPAPPDPSQRDLPLGEGPRARPKTLLPDVFPLTEAMRAFALEGGLDPELQFQKFKDSARAHGRRYIDWVAAFRTWCRNEVDFQERRHSR